MRRTVWLVAALILIAPAVGAQTTPITKRAALSDTSATQAKVLAERVSSTEPIITEFFLAYGGRAQLSFQLRSDGGLDYEVTFGTRLVCAGFNIIGGFTNSSCATDIDAGGIIRLIVIPNGQEGAVRDVRLRFDLVDVNKAAVTVQD